MLSIKPIKNYQNINSFEYATEWAIWGGNAQSIYLQIVDLDQDGLRYIPQGTFTLSATFPSLDTQVVKNAIQVSVLDPSLWRIDLLSTDDISSGSLFFTLVENGVVKNFAASNVLNVSNASSAQPNWCGC